MTKSKRPGRHRYVIPPATIRRLSTWYDEIESSSTEMSRAGKHLLAAAETGDALLAGTRRLEAKGHEATGRAMITSILSKQPQPQLPAFSRERHIYGQGEGRALTRSACKHLNPRALADIHMGAHASLPAADPLPSTAADNLRHLTVSFFELHYHIHLMEHWYGGEQTRVREHLKDIGGEIPDWLQDECAMFWARFWQDLFEFPTKRPIPRCVNKAFHAMTIDRVEPRVQCEGQTVSLFGAFPTSQPSHLKVLFPTLDGHVEPEITSWQADRIDVTVPPDAVHGCVWIYDARAQREYEDCLQEQAGQPTVASSIRELYGSGRRFARLANPEASAPSHCMRAQRFDGSTPTIEDFTLNGEAPQPNSFVRTWNGRRLRVVFRAHGATHLQVIIRDETGTPLVSEQLPPDETWYSYVPAFDEPTRLEVEVRAINDHCYGPNALAPPMFSVKGNALVQMPPDINIVGVEYTQGVQRYDLGNTSGDNNEVPLVRGRRTMVRVFVDSGIQSGIDRTIRVNGTLKIGTRSLQAVNRLEFMARPQADMQRKELDHTLNFIIPGNIVDDDPLQFSLDVFVPDYSPKPGEDSGHRQQFTASMGTRAQEGFKVMGVLYDDGRTGNTVSDEDLLDALDGIRERLPISDPEPELWVPASQSQYHRTTNRWLNNKEAWENLLDDLEDLADDFEDDGEHWLGVVPRDSNYAWGGLATSGHVSWWFDGHPRALTQAQLPATAAHEICHTFGVGHTDCGDPGGLDYFLQSSVPDGRTDEVGVNVFQMKTYDAGGGDLMSYCGGQQSWPAVPLWNLMRGRI